MPYVGDRSSDFRLLLRFFCFSVLLFCGSKLLTLFFNLSQDLQNRRIPLFQKKRETEEFRTVEVSKIRPSRLLFEENELIFSMMR